MQQDVERVFREEWSSAVAILTRVLGDLEAPLELLHLRTEPSGEDVLLEAYLREP